MSVAWWRWLRGGRHCGYVGSWIWLSRIELTPLLLNAGGGLGSVAHVWADFVRTGLVCQRIRGLCGLCLHLYLCLFGMRLPKSRCWFAMVVWNGYSGG